MNLRSICFACVLLSVVSGRIAAQSAVETSADDSPAEATGALSPSAQRVAAVLDRFVNDDTIAVAAVQIDTAWITGLDRYLTEGAGSDGFSVGSLPNSEPAVALFKRLRTQGAREAVLVLGQNDIDPTLGPLFVLTTEEPMQSGGVARQLEQMLKEGEGDLLRVKVRTMGGWVLFGQAATLTAYEQVKPADRPGLTQIATELDAPRTAADSPQAVAAVSPSEGTRRVMAAMWPDLPKPFSRLDAELMGQWKYLKGSLRGGAAWQLNLKADAGSEQAAMTIADVAEVLRDGIASQIPPPRDAEAGAPAGTDDAVDLKQAVTDVLQVKRRGSLLTMQIKHDDKSVVDLVTNGLIVSLDRARQAALRQEQVYNAKCLALGMLNYESAMRHFPASAAYVDEQNKPLLSWRVAILPYLDEGELYDQFHRDEPWDSPHNRKLLKEMPALFGDARHPELAASGKTTFAVPVHVESAFPPVTDQTKALRTEIDGRVVLRPEGIRFRDLKDGSSRTIMIVTLPVDQAIEWTRPVDWNVDLTRAWEQLQGGQTDRVVNVRCDGAVVVLDVEENRDADQFYKLITRDGGEVIEE